MNKTDSDISKNVIERALIGAHGDYREAARALNLSTSDFSDLRMSYGVVATYGRTQGSDVKVVGSGESELAMLQETVSQFDTITQLIESALPKDIHTQMRDAESYSRTDDLVSSITRIKSDFMMAGFHIQSADTGVKDFCNGVNREVDMDSIIQQICDKAPVEDNVPFYFKLSPSSRSLQSVQVFNPQLTEVWPLPIPEKDAPTKAVIFRMSQELKTLWKLKNDRRYNQIEAIKNAIDKLPNDYIQALKNQGIGKHSDGVELRESDGHYIRLINHKGIKDRLISPEMTSIFPDIRLRRLIKDGDYSIFYHLKHMIHSIKIGDPDAKTGTGLDKLLKKVPTKAEAEKWRDAYKTIEKVLLEVVPYSLKHEFVAPDSKYFDGTKYNAVDLRILRWGGIALVLLDGQGGNYSGGYIYMKALVANILKWRRQIERVLQDFYYQIAPNNGRKGALRSKMRDPKTRPRIRFSDNIMKERKQLLDELKFLFEHGGMSWETAHEWMDVSHPVEKQRIVKQWKDDNYKDYFVPVFETSQGLLAPVDRAIYSEESPALKKTTQTEKTTKGQPGRPEVDGKQTDGDKKNRQPRPSES